MSDKPKFDRSIAEHVALRMEMVLKPFCQSYIVAGSYRRGKQSVGDLEILYIPKITRRQNAKDFFAMEDFNEADAQLSLLVQSGILSRRVNSKGLKTWGPLIKLAVHTPTGLPIDFFKISAESWWNYLVCRTGPKESNIGVCMAAQARGYKWEPYSPGFRNLKSLEIVAMQSERDVFEFVGLPFREPQDR